MRLRAPLLSLLMPAAIAFVAGCGGDQGPDYASSMYQSTDQVFAANGLILLTNTLDGTFGAQVSGTPNPFFAKGAAGPRSAAQRAFAIFDRIRLARDLARGGTDPEPSPFALTTAAPSASAIPCPPTETGVDTLDQPLDSDGDGVPDDYAATFDGSCSWLENGLLYNLSGSFRVRDTGTDLASFAFSASNLQETASDPSSTDHVTHTLNGTESATFAATVAHHKEDFILVYNSRISDTAKKVTFTMSELSTFTPGVDSVIVAGGPLPAGTLDYSGDFRITGLNEAGNFRFILQTPVPLHYSPGCGNATGIDSGIFEGLLNGATTKGFRYTWTVCNGPDPQYFGANP